MFWACLLIGLMAVLIVIQMFFPRVSLFALLAIASGGAGLYFAFEAGVATGLVAVGAVVALVPMALYLSLRLWLPYEPQLCADPAAPIEAADLPALAGLSGVAQSPIEPAGVALIAGRRINVIAESGGIPAHTAVAVSRVDGLRVTVKPK